jgi:hypothetical protein
MSVGKVILYGLLATVGPVMAWFVVLIVVASASSGWGTSSAEKAVVGLWVAELVLFGAASILFWRSLHAVSGGGRIAIFAVHGGAQIATMLMLAFSAALAMNR